MLSDFNKYFKYCFSNVPIRRVLIVLSAEKKWKNGKTTNSAVSIFLFLYLAWYECCLVKISCSWDSSSKSNAKFHDFMCIWWETLKNLNWWLRENFSIWKLKNNYKARIIIKVFKTEKQQMLSSLTSLLAVSTVSRV